VLADRDAVEEDLPLPAGRTADQGEVAGPAADVADEDRLAGFDALVPGRALRRDPRVERRLRFLDEHDAAEPGALTAACTVSSRATSSNEAGTVSTTSCADSGCSGWPWSQAPQTWAR